MIDEFSLWFFKMSCEGTPGELIIQRSLELRELQQWNIIRVPSLHIINSMDRPQTLVFIITRSKQLSLNQSRVS
jgi:hypothetical protein